ncbi:MAG: hypothetical protein ACOH2E_07005, partial [Candidatus Paracaedibacter sp.]
EVLMIAHTFCQIFKLPIIDFFEPEIGEVKPPHPSREGGSPRLFRENKGKTKHCTSLARCGVVPRLRGEGVERTGKRIEKCFY